ncbi:MAG: branched-chain-amino-acid transaminase [Bacteriovoracaceae bacterium]
MKMLININGTVCNPEDAKIPVLDRGFLYGDSVYEVTLTYNGIPFLMEEHLDRLWDSALKIDMHLKYSREDIKNEVAKTLKAFNQERVYIRIIITRGEGEIGLDPNLSEDNNLVVIVKELPKNPTWWYEKGVHMIIADVRRLPKKVLDPNLKSGNYLSNVMAHHQAKKIGAFDAILLNMKGYVTEGTTNNIWMVRKDTVITPPLEAGLLEGITRRTLLKIGKAHGIKMIEDNFTPDELKSADEAFLTSSTRELVPITKIDEEVIGHGAPGPMYLKLHQFYREFVQKSIGN